MPLSTSSSVGDKRAANGAPRPARSQKQQRRLSLPVSTHSSTVITKPKVDRRRSLRRQSSSFSSKENNNYSRAPPNPHFSPPETRSAKKTRLQSQFMQGGAGALLTFSPPNQAENARREKEKIDRKEMERARRIAHLRAEGQRMDFSTSGKALSLPPLSPGPKKKPPPAANNGENQPPPKSPSPSNMEAMKQFDEDLIQRIADATSNNKSDEKLLADWKNLHQEYAEARETFAGEKSRLEVELQHAKQQASEVEQMKASILEQVALLETENSALTTTTQTIEAELKQAKDELQKEQATVAELKASQSVENSTIEYDIATFEEENHILRNDLEERQRNTEALQTTIASHEATIGRLEKIIIPELEASLECEKDKSALLENKLENLQVELQESVAAVDSIQTDLQQMQQQTQESENLLRQEIESREVMAAKLREEVESKTIEAISMQQSLRDLELQMESNSEKFARSVAEREEEAKLLKTQLKNLNDALEETMQNLDESEQINNELKGKLSDALTKRAEVSKNLDAQLSATAGVIEGLTDQLAQERKDREKAELQLVESKNSLVVQAQQTHRMESEVRQACQERDDARGNMQGFDERENELYRKLQQGDLIRRQMHSKLMQLMGNIRVVVRVRPVLPHETTGNNPFSFPQACDTRQNVTHTSSSSDITKNMIEIQEPPKDRGGLKDRRKTWRFGFDNVFGPSSTQNDVWESVEPLIQSVVDGFNVTLFAYGQTGSGKTHTMLGGDYHDGIIGRSVGMMFEKKLELESMSRGDTRISISVELLEVYNEKVRDLLSSDPSTQDLKVTPEEVFGNIICDTSSQAEVAEVLSKAQKRRCVKGTASNAVSSRSHMIFTLNFTMKTPSGTERLGKLNICDLAGSERLSKSGAHLVGGSLLEESKNINKSLSVLSNVIEKLQAGDANPPFRESKLTMVLKDSLSGNSKTLAIVCCNPLSDSVNESVSTLRFAEKVNRVDLKAVANFSC